MISKMKSFSWKEAMRYRNEIFGIVAIWILFYHIHENVGGFSFLPLKIICRAVSKGNMGVDIFLLLSAIGLSASVGKNSLSGFYINRLNRVIIPYLIISMPYFIWYNFCEMDNGIGAFLGDVTTANFWITGDYPIWYVAFIIIMYALFPLIHKFDVETRHISTACLLIISVIGEYILYISGSWLYDNAEKALSRIPVFLFGILMAPHILKGAKIALWKVIFAFSLGGGLFVLICLKSFDIVLTRYIYGVISVCAVIAYGFLRNIFEEKRFGKVLSWAGGISLEIYIVHVLLLRIIRYNEWWGILPKALWYIVIPMATIMLAKLISVLCNYIYLQKATLKKRG